MNDNMEEKKKEDNTEEASASAGSASKFGLTSAGTVVMDESDFCLQYFRAMECWKRPTQERNSNDS